MSKVNLDEQLAKAEEQRKRAEEKVKRLKERKQLRDAKKAIAENVELKKRVAELEKKQTNELFDLQHELKQVEDSNAWLRGAVNNLVNDIQKLPTWNASEKDNKVTLVNRQVIINRLNGILKGQQPKKK